MKKWRLKDTLVLFLLPHGYRDLTEVVCQRELYLLSHLTAPSPSQIAQGITTGEMHYLSRETAASGYSCGAVASATLMFSVSYCEGCKREREAGYGHTYLRSQHSGSGGRRRTSSSSILNYIVCSRPTRAR